jgi:hypothetical protein
MLYAMGIALFIAGYFVGKEHSAINYQRQLLDAERDAAFWKEKMNPPPDGPPKLPDHWGR